IGIGLYPRLMTDSYTASIQELVKRDELALQRIKKPSALMIRNTTMTPAVVSSPRLPITQTR
ncbi:MAG: NAD(P)H-quinone oxidoreductase subunit 4, partial [Cyanobacteriota bacterium]|nr:NAD(P)H-quinone oxidoreductase subunit 4 [Cyanobacteriota bacterium]